MKIGLIGTGLMGKPMAIRLWENNFELSVYNRTKSKTEDLGKMGIPVFETPEQLVKNNEVIVLMLSDYHAIKSVLFDPDLNFADKTIIQMSTIAPEESNRLKDEIEKLNGEYFEAPVLGSIPQIKQGELIVLVGGTKTQFDSFHKLFEVWSNKIMHIGKVGKAAAVKLALNQLIITETTAFSMSLGYVRNSGVDVEIFMDILRSSALYAPTFDKKLERYLHRNFEKPNFPLKHLLKDLRLISKSFESKEIDNKILEATKPILENAIEKKMGDLDYSALYNIIHPEK